MCVALLVLKDGVGHAVRMCNTSDLVVNVFIPYLCFVRRNILGCSRKFLRSICDVKWLHKLLQCVSNVFSESLHRKIGDSNNLPESISLISENS